MISNRAFAAAICVFVVIVWAHHRLTNTSRVPTGPIADTSIVREAAACLVFEETILPERYADYRKHYQILVDGTQSQLPFIRSFAMGGRSSSSANYERPSCHILYPQLFNDNSDPLVDAVTGYNDTFNTLRDKTVEAETLYNQPHPDIELAQQLDADIAQGMQELKQRGLVIRKLFEEPQFLARNEQLAAIEYRLGHDQHWHTLNFMILARQTINYLDQTGENARLSPDELKALHGKLADALKDAERYFEKMPNLKSANQKHPVWTVIKDPAQAWLLTLETLQQHWAHHADVEQLNKDLLEAEQHYDQLVSRYNATVRGQY
ncbi:hypothetical protein N018_13680 [Pseudomonas syringae CC1557]|uniref:DUF3829 domain-containing protein n=1 Tax=Pseudomonas syringae CC1557 TaxID=1357279 RepID=W0MRX9_PSESX|nr:DUF3829 domain-containing protein [Pseudomonas syringae]AHG41197.1 hypothetical protein N018_13680 [Pseudomonas syringae CC1557]